MNGRWSELSDEALGRRLAAELPRYSAPSRLRAHILHAARTRRTRRPVWLAPTLSALATAALFVLVIVPTLPRTSGADPVQRLASAVIAEHTRASMWGARRPDVIPTALPWLEQQSGIGLARAFLGDERLSFIGAEPVYLDWRRGVALHYSDPQGHHVTYIALPAPGLPLPERHRVQVATFRPALVRVGEFGAWVWKEGDLACFLVSDLQDSDLESFKNYFVTLRTSTVPFPVY
jgi:hypothetical protein